MKPFDKETGIDYAKRALNRDEYVVGYDWVEIPDVPGEVHYDELDVFVQSDGNVRMLTVVRDEAHIYVKWRG